MQSLIKWKIEHPDDAVRVTILRTCVVVMLSIYDPFKEDSDENGMYKKTKAIHVTEQTDYAYNEAIEQALQMLQN